MTKTINSVQSFLKDHMASLNAKDFLIIKKLQKSSRLNSADITSKLFQKLLFTPLKDWDMEEIKKLINF